MQTESASVMNSFNRKSFLDSEQIHALPDAVPAEYEAVLLGSEADLDGDVGFKTNVHLSGLSGISIDLCIKASEPLGGISTVLDFSHTEYAGCALQIQPSAIAGCVTVAWICSGAALTEDLRIGEWHELRVGCDQNWQQMWMEPKGWPRRNLPLNLPPFAEDAVALGIGHWLHDRSRLFIGQIRALKISASDSAPNVSKEKKAQHKNGSPDVSERFQAPTRTAALATGTSLLGPITLSDEIQLIGSFGPTRRDLPARTRVSLGNEQSFFGFLWLFLDNGTSRLQTILDLEHTAESGFSLNYHPAVGASPQNGVLTATFKGELIEIPITTGTWHAVSFGYNAPDSEGWVTLDGSDPHSMAANSPIFRNASPELGIGHWLNHKDRELSGAIENLHMCAAISSPTLHQWASSIAQPLDLPSKKRDVTLPNARSYKSDEVLGIDFDLSKNTTTVLAALDSPQEVSYENDEDVGAAASHIQAFAILLEFVKFFNNEDIIGAAHHANRIVQHGYSISTSVQGTILRFRLLPVPADLGKWARELVKLPIFRNGASWRLCITLAVSCAQLLYQAGRRDLARGMLIDYQSSRGPEYLLNDVDRAQAVHTTEGEDSHPLVKNLALGGLGYLDYFKNRHCDKPFEDFEVRSDGEIFVCCPSYLPYSIGNIYTAKSVDEILHTDRGDKIRGSILKHDFRYCRWLSCTKIMTGSLPVVSTESKVTYEPVDFRLSYDPTCNLWCPSCRKEKIVAKGAQRERLLKLTDAVILPTLKTAHSVMMNGYGDVFASKACRRILEQVTPEEYPKLQFSFITNGVLFTREEWAKFPNIHTMVKSIRVSVDAATKETYDQVRLGGDWDILMENLAFMSELRRSGEIKEFMLSFVVQDLNFREMAEFAKLGQRLHADMLVFEGLLDWGTFGAQGYRERAVHFTDHPLNADFKVEVERLGYAVPAASGHNVELQKRGTPEYRTLYAVNM